MKYIKLPYIDSEQFNFMVAEIPNDIFFKRLDKVQYLFTILLFYEYHNILILLPF